MDDDRTLPIETVKWREGIGRTLATIDKRTAGMELVMKNFVTAPQVDTQIKNAVREELGEHTQLCGLKRDNEQLKRDTPAKKIPNSIAPPVIKKGGDMLKNLTLQQSVKYAVFLGFLIGSFVAGLQIGG